MRRFRLNTGLIFASWALMLIFGCHKKKPPIPPEDTPPTIIAEIPIEQEPDNQRAQPQPQPEATSTPAAEKPEHKPPKHPKPHPPAQKKPDEGEKPAPAEEAKNAPPPKVIIQENSSSAGNGQPAPGAANDSSAAGQMSTQQLLDRAENNLRNIKRDLSDNEKSMVVQIQGFISQSKDAIKEGDNPKAHGLALKAQVLSDELVKGQ
jgi:type IV secretory pathway VirB10-like protein